MVATFCRFWKGLLTRLYSTIWTIRKESSRDSAPKWEISVPCHVQIYSEFWRACCYFTLMLMCSVLTFSHTCASGASHRLALDTGFKRSMRLGGRQSNPRVERTEEPPPSLWSYATSRTLVQRCSGTMSNATGPAMSFRASLPLQCKAGCRSPCQKLCDFMGSSGPGPSLPQEFLTRKGFGHGTAR